jgi:hypothetical protein
MITTQIPTLTRVSIIDNDEGYFIKREKTDEMLDIRFNTAKQAIDYARANRLIVIVEDDSGEIDQ